MAKSKDKSSKKKRHHEENAETTTPTPTQTSPSKKGKSKRADDEEEALTVDLLSASPFQTQTISLYLPLSSVAMKNQVPGLCAEHLSPLVLTYFAPARGTVLSYDNVRVSERPLSSNIDKESSPPLARSIDEYAISMIWLTADFLVFRPTKGAQIEGFVNLHNQSHLGLLCYNLFNVSIPASRLPKDWSWVWLDDGRTPPPEPMRIDAITPPPSAQGDSTKDKRRSKRDVSGEGYFKDKDGKKVDGLVRFRVRDFETAMTTDRDRSYIGIHGTLLNEDEDSKVDEEEEIQRKNREARNKRPGHSGKARG